MSRKQRKISDPELIEDLINIARFHSDLMDRVTEINFSFGFHMLLEFTSLFFYEVFSGFAIYRTIVHFGSAWTCYTVNNVIWGNFHFWTLTYFIKVSYNLKERVSET